MLDNGELLDRAEKAGNGVVITADRNMQYQQNIGSRSFALIVLGANRWPLIESSIEDIRAVPDGIQTGEVREAPIPMRSE